MPNVAMNHSNSLFTRFGVELEYMIVNTETLNVSPVADRVLEHFGGASREVNNGLLSWSNELALHVIELKTSNPAPQLDDLSLPFQAEVQLINRHLEKSGLCLLPTAMHPWMNPQKETLLWPHGSLEIYQAFDRIFDCRGHGWSNLQSVHLNLPFSNEEEFIRLHSAIRIVLPLIPAIAASSPFMNGHPGHDLDNRLAVYRNNCARIPSVTGRIVPERIRSIASYHDRILSRIYRDLEPYDSEKILRHEWTNARGAIARFERNTIEIRVIDIQESPVADLAILQLVTRLLQHLCGPNGSALEKQLSLSTRSLEAILNDGIHEAEHAVISQPAFLEALGIAPAKSIRHGELWRELFAMLCPIHEEWHESIAIILDQGCLAQRIKKAVGKTPTKDSLFDTYQGIRNCLNSGRMFHA